MNYVFPIIFTLLFSSPSVSAHPPAVGATVTTTSGKVTGHAARNRTAVSEYLGIPYAQPPIGDLRFAVPRTYNFSQAITAAAYVRFPQFTIGEVHR